MPALRERTPDERINAMVLEMRRVANILANTDSRHINPWHLSELEEEIANLSRKIQVVTY